MEAVILITLLMMCVIIVFILADNSWFKWEKTADIEYDDEDYDTMADDEDELEDDFEDLQDDDMFEVLGDTCDMGEVEKVEQLSREEDCPDDPSDKDKV